MLFKKWPYSLALVMIAIAGCPNDDPDPDAAVKDAATIADMSTDGAGSQNDSGNVGDGSTSDAAPVNPVSEVNKQRYVDELTFISQPRSGQNAHWLAVQNRCATVLEAVGFTVTRQEFDSGTSSDSSVKGVNVIGTLAGTTKPDEQIIISAHYDSVPNVADCPGADDNGTGVAAALEAARVLAKKNHDRTLIVACWDEEETQLDSGIGLMGSTAYAVQAAALPRDDIKMVYVMDMIGYHSSTPNSQTIPDEAAFRLIFPDALDQVIGNCERCGDFIGVFGNLAGRVGQTPSAAETAINEMRQTAVDIGFVEAATQKSRVVGGNALTAVLLAAGLARSDHTPFMLGGWPAIFITDTANFRNPNYHCPDANNYDTLESIATLSEGHDFAVNVIKSMVGSADKLLQSGN